MFRLIHSVYLGEEKSGETSAFLSSERYFIVFKLENEMEKDAISGFLNRVKTKLEEKDIDKLQDLDEAIGVLIREENLPLGLSMSIFFVKPESEVCFLKTVGEGVIYLYRKGKLGKIISGDLSASGYVKEGDLFLLTTKEFEEKFQDADEFKKNLSYPDLEEIKNALAGFLKPKDDSGLIGLLIRAEKTSDNKFELPPLPLYLPKSKKSLLTWALTAIIFVILIWSVVLGYKRREIKKARELVQKKREKIVGLLKKAEEEAFFDIPTALSYISQAKKELKTTEERLQGKKLPEIKEINQLIADTEKRILKTESAEIKEFFDLKIIDKKAQGTRFFLADGLLVILDRENSKIF